MYDTKEAFDYALKICDQKHLADLMADLVEIIESDSLTHEHRFYIRIQLKNIVDALKH